MFADLILPKPNLTRNKSLFFIFLLSLISLSLFTKTSFATDTAPPFIYNLTPAENSYTPWHKPLIQADIFDSESGIDQNSIILKIDGIPVSYNYSPLTGRLSYLPVNFLSTGRHNLSLEVKDNQENTSYNLHSFYIQTVFYYTLFSDSNLEIKGNPQISGNTYSKANTNLTGNPVVQGAGYATGTITYNSSNPPYTNGIYQNVEARPYPEIDFDYYKYLALNSGTYLTGEIHLSNKNNLSGLIYVEGNIKISKDNLLPTTIIATGNINLSGNTNLSSYLDNLTLIAKGDVEAVGKGNIGGVIYSNNKKAKLAGDKSSSGAIAGKELIEVLGNSVATDTIPPNPPYLNPPTSPTNNSTITISGQAEPNSTIEILEGINVLKRTLTDSNSLFNTTLDLTQEGTHILSAVAIDSSGNISLSSDPRTIIIDKTNPLVEIISPENNSTVSNIVNINVNASDNISLDKVELYIDNQLKTTFTNPPYSYNWDTTGLSGEHTIKAIAYDKAGNTNSDTHTVTIAGNIITPQGGIYNSSDNNLSLEFPPNSVSENIQIVYTPQPPIDISGFNYTTHFFTLEAYNQNNIPVTQFNQPVKITVKNIDPLYLPTTSLYYQDSITNNWIIIPESTIDYTNNSLTNYLNHLTLFALLSDNTPPTTTINTNGTLGENNYYTSDVTVTLNSTDTGSGLDKTEYSLDELTWNTYTNSFILNTEGTTTIQAKSTDKQGNTENPPIEKTIQIDKTNPLIFNQSPIQSVQTYTPLISANLTDSASGINSSSIVMKLDNQTVNHSYNSLTQEVSYISSTNLSRGKHTVNISAKDNAGNLTTSSFSFVVFGTPVGGTISTNTTWIKDASPYILEGSVIINQGTTLTVEPGTIVKIDRARIDVNGTLTANGTSSDKIVFTSIWDDSYGGDTNNDGNTSVPNWGYWGYIRLSTSSKLNHTIIKYGGGTYDVIGTLQHYSNGALYINGGSPEITNSLISDNINYGIKIGDSATPVISGNTITKTKPDPTWWLNGIGSAVYVTESPSPTINYNNIYNNNSYGLYNASTGAVNAKHNWWGIATNPLNTIYGNVDYSSWALSPYTGQGGGDSPEGRYGQDTPSGYAGEPVNTTTGNYTYEHEDINIPGKGIPVQIVRSYNSQDNSYNGSFGYGWTHNYNLNLRFNSDESVTLMRAKGERYTFTKNPDETYATPEGIFETLTKNLDNTYILKFKDQSKYNFNSSGYLTNQIDKYGNTTLLSYTNNLLTTVADSGGRTLTFTYTNNRITKIQDQTGRKIQYGYDANGNLTTVTDMNNKTTTFTYDSSHQLTTIKESEPSTNPFLTNNYDSNNKVDLQKDAFLNTFAYSYDTANKKTTTTDNKGKQTIHQFDDRYRLTKSTDPLLNSVTSAFSTLDLPDSVTNQNNKTTSFTYDTNGNTTSTKDPLNHEITASYDLTNNNLLWTKDPLNNQTTYNYDATGKFLQSIASPIGTTTFDYYTDGLLKTLTDANSHNTSFGYNTYGNLTSIQDALLKTTSFEYDPVVRMTASIDANTNKTQFVYDNEGNILTIKDPLAISDPTNRHQVDFTYDGNNNQKTFKDANNNLTQFGYDDMDNLTNVIDANSKTTNYTYDANYNLETVTDSLLHTTTYSYYDDNKLSKITDPLNNILEFNYDPAGNLSKTIYPNSNETYYSYYDDNLLNTVTYKNEPTSYTYTYNPTHTLNTVTDNNGKVFSYGYDNGNRLTSANDQTNSAITGGFTVQRNYDGVSNLTSLSYGSTNLVYGYNDRDDMTSLSVNGQSSTVFTYDDTRNRTDVNTPDSTNRHYTYNDANRITQVKNTTISGIQTFDYTHDSNGNILSENNVTYGYDSLNRLLSWNQGGINTTYQYDDAGNLLTVKENDAPTKTFTYNEANQIANAGYTYDVNGNMTSDGIFNYEYDGENRLKKTTKVSGGSTVAEYTYDYMGRRVSTTEGGSTTYFHYDGWNVVAETDSSGAVIASYTYDNRNQLVSLTKGGATYYYQYNAHGDVVSLTNSAGQVVNTYEYDPWGKILSANETIENPYRYAGYRYDSETGLYYLQNRYYKPDIARFITKDKYPSNVKNPQSLNPYVYTNDNPTNFVDPSGELAFIGLAVPAIAGGFAGAIGYTTGLAISNYIQGQSLMNGFRGRELLMAAAGGAVGSVAITVTGAGLGGAGVIGAVVSGIQYMASSYLTSQTPTAAGFATTLGAGGIAGAIGGGAKARPLYGFLRNIIAGTVSPYVTEAFRKGAPYLKKILQTLNPLNDSLMWGERP
ncbi:MAG: hypothetical protein HY776_06030 [Actinobacteria bacterium]|nr:hypothetical protein [Actinomycetota bacterium]